MAFEEIGAFFYQMAGPYLVPLIFIGILIIVAVMFILRFSIGEAMLVGVVLSAGIAALNVSPIFENMKLLALGIAAIVIGFFFWVTFANG